MDAATGLLYVGNGQYYDPATGRFLTRDVKPNSSNPYVPWDPTVAILGPLAAMALFFGSKRKRGKWDILIIIVLLGISTGIGVIACTPPPTTPATGSKTPPVPASTQTPVPVGGETSAPSVTSTPAPPIIWTLPDCPTPTLTPGLDLFGIIFEGSWSSSELHIVLQAVQKTGEKFAPILQGISSDAAFSAAYGTPFNFVKSGGSGGTYCEGGRNRVVCYGNAPLSEDYPVHLLVHELGHALQHSRYAADTQGPYASLQSARIEDDLGNWVTGTHPGAAGQFERTSRGYLSELQPHTYHGSDWPDWQSNLDHRARNEDFADMFMNWVFNSFDYRPQANGAGFKRSDWMERNMYGWITG